VCKHFSILPKAFICTAIAYKLFLPTSIAVTEDDHPSAMIYNELHRAEFLVRGQQILSQLRNSLHLIEPKGSMSSSQEPIICPCPEPD
jgi:hypothetical protein